MRESGCLDQKMREFKPGELVRPTSNNKLLAQWQGPFYQIVTRMGKFNRYADELEEDISVWNKQCKGMLILEKN